LETPQISLLANSQLAHKISLIEVDLIDKTKRETLKISSLIFENRKNFLPLQHASNRSRCGKSQTKRLKSFSL
jgi:hypothetical protein